MRILYVFPHPDDESFGPAPLLARQRRQGHEVYLLTLTKGEATKQRQKYGYSKAEMGDVREREMRAVARELDLTDLTVLDLPDGAMRDLDPLDLEAVVREHLERVQPHVVVTYAVHGISGHPDHLVAHAVVKRVFVAMRREGAAYLGRLAFFTLPEPGNEKRPPHLKGSPRERIGAIVHVDAQDLDRGHAALACYETYQDVVEAHDPLAQVAGDGVCFELWHEHPDPPLGDLFAGLDD